MEHILPKKWDPESWNRDDFDDGNHKIDDFKLRLGNMTLLHKAINSKLKNAGFLEKRDEGYKKSSLKINKDTVCNYDRWDHNVIKEREDIFAKYAKEIWSLDRPDPQRPS